MKIRFSPVIPLAFGVSAAFAAFACGSAKERTSFVSDNGKTDPKDAGSSPNEPGDIPNFGDGAPACDGLACQQVACEEEGVTTTLTGKVYDPGGRVPLYNVMVYVPSGDPTADLPPIPQGVQCETCASVVLNPLVSTLTNTSGEFTLENVPVGEDVPVVMQIGKWRRRITVNVKNACAENKVAKADSHLPRNGEEGDMPHIAVTTGSNDSLECLFAGMGVDDTEFVAGDDMSGHIHMFSGNASTSLWPAAKDNLWNDLEELKKYDITLFSCEGSENLSTKGGSDTGPREAVRDYLNMGGRLFATHYHYVWFKESPDPAFQGLAEWTSTSYPTGTGEVNTSFPKGQALAEWLEAVGASSTFGEIALDNMTRSINGVSSDVQSWIEFDGIPKYFSFNTPIGAAEDQQCGRSVFSDLHMFSSHKELSACGSLKAQQKALEFMFFDLAGCVQSDQKPPVLPN